MKIEILNSHICDPLNDIDRVDTIYMADTKILSIGEPPAGWQADQSIDASGLYCIPGLVDIAARLGIQAKPNRNQSALRPMPLSALASPR